jgi:hypothetical protein
VDFLYLNMGTERCFARASEEEKIGITDGGHVGCLVRGRDTCIYITYTCALNERGFADAIMWCLYPCVA